MFKVNNKDTRTSPMVSLWCLYCSLLTYFTLYSSVFIVNFELTPCSSVFIVNFEDVIDHWDVSVPENRILIF